MGEWRESRLVLLPKAGRDLSKAKGWRPIALINTMSKWIDKWAAEEIQTKGESFFHWGQMGSRKGMTAQDALMRLLRRAGKAKKENHPLLVGLEGGFQNVTGEVVEHIAKVPGLRHWCTWIRGFCGPRRTIWSWDGVERGVCWLGWVEGRGLQPD